MINNFPRVTIILPTYNAANCIEHAIRSVIDQAYPNLEFIIIDGGSRDRPIEIIKKYEAHIYYWVSEPDQGIYDAMNKGLAVATGDWIYFLGSDDALAPNVLSELFINQDTSAYQFIYGNVVFRQSGQAYGRAYSFEWLATRVICHQAIFARKALFDKYGPFSLRYPACADYAWMIAAFADNPARNLYLNQVIAHYDEEGFSNEYIDKNFLNDKDLLCREYLKLPAQHEEYLSVIGKRGLEHLKKRHYRQAFYNLWPVLQKAPNKMYWIKASLYWLKQSIIHKPLDA